MNDRQLIPLKQARDMLGVSHTTMARFVREGRFTIYENPLDRRQKLVDMAEIQAFATPLPVNPAGLTPSDGETPQPVRVDARYPRAEPAAEEVDEELEAARQLLRALLRAAHEDPDAPFIQTQAGDLIHPGIKDGRIKVPAAIFNRLLREGYLRILQGVYHRRGEDVGREFIITQAGHEGLQRV